MQRLAPPGGKAGEGRMTGAPLRPVIIIGAGRSGTNILRDVLVADPEATTWPCDEINYIWRHGSRGLPTDEFGPANATADVRTYVRRAFVRQSRRGNAPIVVEKTCANSLRVEFVAGVVPEARFVWIRRDPVAVVASAMKRWRAQLDIPYVARKARFVPPSDLPYYATRYLRQRISKLFAEEESLPSWGPRFEGMEEAVRTHPLHIVCALQWRRCEERARTDFERLGGRAHVEIQYEDLVRDPDGTIRHVTKWVYGRVSEPVARAARKAVRDTGAGRGAIDLTEQQIKDIRRIAQGGLA